jgi:hypothetical protein
MRRHLNYANVIATLALFFAMSGGALAAKHYLINSTKQINPKVIKKLKGNTGPRGATGATGPIGPQGKEGAPNPNATNANHATSADNATTVGGHSVRWLLVNPGGTIVSQSGGFAITAHPSAGVYVVDAGSSVNGHMILTSDGLAGDSAFRGITVAGPCAASGSQEGIDCNGLSPGSDDGNHIFVATTDTTNAKEADHSFYLQLF